MKATSSTREVKRTSRGQPAWRLVSSHVEAFVTETGGQVGPVTFDRQGRKLNPYSVAPWAEESLDHSVPAILKVLRGDFFCLPFGGNTTPYHGEKHPVHGETANARWRFESLQTGGGRCCLHLSLATKKRPGRVDKRIWLVDGQDAIYSQHIIAGMSGPMNLGHHAMLKFPDEPGSGCVSTSRFVYGQVFPQTFERPEARGYSALEPGAEFRSLTKVPTRTGEMADLSRYPARRGFEDLVMVVNDLQTPFAWTAVAFPKDRYVWFALKDPRILPQTIFWISNGGRHYPPWNGRHVNVMGLEEVCSYFHLGLAESARKNPLTAKGFPTCIKLNPKKPLVVPYIMGIARTPPGFDRVAAIQPGDNNRRITLLAASGKKATATVDLDFLGSTGA
jgi:hypothetical protein